MPRVSCISDVDHLVSDIKGYFLFHRQLSVLFMNLVTVAE
jgi:hypothetical protein